MENKRLAVKIKGNIKIFAKNFNIEKTTLQFRIFLKINHLIFCQFNYI